MESRVGVWVSCVAGLTLLAGTSIFTCTLRPVGAPPPAETAARTGSQRLGLITLTVYMDYSREVSVENMVQCDVFSLPVMKTFSCEIILLNGLRGQHALLGG
mgnify:CR=1 FL=1